RAFAIIPASGEDHWLASAGESGTIRIWNPVTGRLMREFRGHSGAVISLAVFFDPMAGSVLVSSGEDSTVRFWDIDAGGDAIDIFTTPSPVTTLAVAQTVDGHRYVACARSTK